MAPTSMWKKHQKEASELGSLLNDLQQRSSIARKDLVVPLHFSLSKLCQLFNGRSTLTTAELSLILRMTRATHAEHLNALALNAIIHETEVAPEVQAVTVPTEPVPTVPAPAPSLSRGPQDPMYDRIRRLAVAVGMTVLIGLLSTFHTPASPNVTSPAPVATITCPGTAPSPTAWAATCTSKAVFDRAQRTLTLFDSSGEGSSVLTFYRINGSTINKLVNSDSSKKPPKSFSLETIDDHTTITFQTCVANRSAPNPDHRKPSDCGDWITDPGK